MLRTLVLVAAGWLASSLVLALAIGRAARRSGLASVPGSTRAASAESSEVMPAGLGSVGTAPPAWRADEAEVFARAVAVAVHGVQASASLITGSSATLAASWGQLDDAQRNRLLQTVIEHGALVEALMGDLLRGVPAHLREALDALLLERPVEALVAEPRERHLALVGASGEAGARDGGAGAAVGIGPDPASRAASGAAATDQLAIRRATRPGGFGRVALAVAAAVGAIASAGSLQVGLPVLRQLPVLNVSTPADSAPVDDAPVDDAPVDDEPVAEESVSDVPVGKGFPIATEHVVATPESKGSWHRSGGDAPGRSGDDAPGRSGEAPGRSGDDAPGRSGEAPGHSGDDAPGRSEEVSGRSGDDAPGRSGEAPGGSGGDSRGGSGAAPGRAR